MTELLNVVDDHDQIIGQESREEIHRRGLWHREIHVYFITPQGEVIFQHRAKDKDTYPDLLDATVGGHVEIGESYEEAALKEVEEETGLKLSLSDLIFINKIQKSSEDKKTNKINRVFNSRYLYFYSGSISDLKIEAGKAIGFEPWPLLKLPQLDEAEQSRFIPYVFHFAATDLTYFVRQLLSSKIDSH